MFSTKILKNEISMNNINLFMLYSWSFGDLCLTDNCVLWCHFSRLSAVCRLKLWPWRSWLGCFPASTRSSRATPCASCSTSPSTRRCAARWSRQDSSPNSPHCSVICLCFFCLFLSMLTGLLCLCVYDVGCTVCVSVSETWYRRMSGENAYPSCAQWLRL